MTTTVTQAQPDWMKTARPSAAFAGVDPNESLAEGIGAGYPVIGYKGKIWSIRQRGENHIFLRPDDGTPVSYIDVVILRQAKVKAKSYYLPGEFEEQASAGKRPICASIDGVRPDPDAQQKQSLVCATCPKNEWRKDQNGKNTRDCADYKRLAVFIIPNQTVRLFGQPLMEPAFLRVPPASLQALAVFGDNMAQQGWPYSSFITRISFDPTKAHPEFLFKAIQMLTDGEAATVVTMRNDLGSQRITGEDEITRREVQYKALGGPTQSGATQLGQQARAAAGLSNGIAPSPAPVPVVASQPVQQALPNPPVSDWGAVPNTKPAAEEPKTVDLPAQGGGAFGFAAPPPEPNPNPQPGAMVGQTAEDVGSAVEDPDLDAKIAAMLQTA